MNKTGLKKFISQVINDTSKSIDERIEECFGYRDEAKSDDEHEKLGCDIVMFSMLIEMILKENDSHEHDEPLLQLITLLAEAYVATNNFRPVGDLAYDTLELMRDEMTPVGILRESIPRIATAISKSVYRHYLYEILLRYVEVLLKENALDDAAKPQVTHMLRLHILLDGTCSLERLIDKKLKQAIAELFSQKELLDIMLNPEIDYLRKDPIEYTHEWENIFYDVEEELDKMFADEPKYMGFCFLYWSAKKNLLKEKYGIEWRSPSQMNPHVLFD